MGNDFLNNFNVELNYYTQTMKLKNENNIIEILFIQKRIVEIKALKIISKGMLISDNDINECRPLMINYCNLRVNSNELFEAEDSWGEKMKDVYKRQVQHKGSRAEKIF